jgi:hypothetical protein
MSPRRQTQTPISIYRSLNSPVVKTGAISPIPYQRTDFPEWEAPMHEDPYVIRLNIQHYQALLKLHSSPRTRQQLLRLLVKAQAELPIAEAERSGLERNTG